MFARLFRKDRLPGAARRLYHAILEDARRPALYGPEGAPDTVDGRFDVIVLHAILLIRRLREGGEEPKRAAQLMFDILFDDMDAALREMGTGDLSVGKKIREMGEAFYGRASAYEDALRDENAGALAQAIERNMFDADGETPGPAATRLAAYAIDSARLLAGQEPRALLDGQRPAFAPLS